MAAKNKLRYQRNRSRALLDIVNDAIEACLRSIERTGIKATASDLIRLIRLRLAIDPIEPPRPQCIWVDNPPSPIPFGGGG